MQDSTAIKIAAIMGLTILEATAIMCNIDGAYFLPVVAAIAGLAGWTLKSVASK